MFIVPALCLPLCKNPFLFISVVCVHVSRIAVAQIQKRHVSFSQRIVF